MMCRTGSDSPFFPRESAARGINVSLDDMSRWEVYPMCVRSVERHRLEVLAAPAGNAQRLPGCRIEVFGEEDDLTHLVGMVGHLPIERLDDRVALAPDVHVPQQFVRLR